MFGFEGCQRKTQDERVVLGVAVVAGASACLGEAESSVEGEGSGAAGTDLKRDRRGSLFAAPI
jgi:hypothetical protein